MAQRKTGYRVSRVSAFLKGERAWWRQACAAYPLYYCCTDFLSEWDTLDTLYARKPAWMLDCWQGIEQGILQGKG